MEHDPLGSSCNAVVALIEGREFGQHSVVCVGHPFVCGCIFFPLLELKLIPSAEGYNGAGMYVAEFCQNDGQ